MTMDGPRTTTSFIKPLLLIALSINGCTEPPDTQTPAITAPAEIAAAPPPVTTPPSFKSRRHAHVRSLLHQLTPDVVELCIAHGVPPAAVLGIIALESGWGQGYVARVSGNIMSLNAFARDTSLPALDVYVSIDSGEIILSPEQIAQYAPDELRLESRPPSLKKDYRPAPFAGTTEDLAYFLDRPEERHAAQLRNVADFLTRFVHPNSKVAAFREARAIVNNAAAYSGPEVLFDPVLNERFVRTLGGRPRSYNVNADWPGKVLAIMNSVGAIPLTQAIFQGQSFDEAWDHKPGDLIAAQSNL